MSKRSKRLAEKSHRVFHMPTRDEVWDKIDEMNENVSSSSSYSHLKPNNGISDFIKERNRYNHDPNLAPDSPSDDEILEETYSDERKIPKKKKKRLVEVSEGSSTEEEIIISQKKKHLPKIASDDSDSLTEPLLSDDYKEPKHQLLFQGDTLESSSSNDFDTIPTAGKRITTQVFIDSEEEPTEHSINRGRRLKIMQSRREKKQEKFKDFKRERQRTLNKKTLKEMELTDESDSRGNMINLLYDIRQGKRRPQELCRAERTRRLFSLDLDKNTDFAAAHNSGINTLDLDVDEQRYLLSGSNDGKIAVFDTRREKPDDEDATYKSLFTINKSNNKKHHKFSVTTVKWYPFDNGMFLSCSSDTYLKIWDSNKLKVADEFQFPGPVYKIALSSHAKQHSLIAVGSSTHSVRLIDMRSGSASHKLQGHTELVSALNWSKTDEFILASGSDDNRIFIWDIRRAKSCICSLDQHDTDIGTDYYTSHKSHTAHGGAISCVEFSDDGLYLSSFGVDNRLRLWSAMTGKNLMINYGTVNSNPQVEMSITSRCNPNLIFVPSDNKIQVFNLITGQRVNTLKGHFNCVNCTYLNDDTLELYSGGNDRNIICWSDRKFEKDKRKEKNPKNFFSRSGVNDDWDSDND
ncbi:DgyrCDS6920 [Dimorphilus gyrociliatus]|uniref:DgyrCDS6920 n=1 Tax=Dimorphilus gyrociliatus TaxID=2664684 RepID=A0A7I8VR33_9ANNE|nr:DgyrCDS6920 [Dimorphilus gyrociliatus]